MIIHDNKELSAISSGRKPILILFPFAGGNTYSYRGLVEPLEAVFDIICTELPGRNLFMDMSLQDSIPGLVDFVCDTWIHPLDLNRPYILFGHSMGALMAYLVARDISRRGNIPLPSHIIAAGMKAPSITRNDLLHHLPSAGFWKKVEAMGGIPKELSESEEVKKYFEPILRSDFTAVETYTYTARAPLDIPITVMAGTDDIDLQSLLPWQKETVRPVSFYRWEGNHFFIFNHIPRIVSCLESIADNFKRTHCSLNV